MRGERYGAVEGKTPKISVPQARRLLASITAPTPVARRDRAVLAYTASRAGAVAVPGGSGETFPAGLGVLVRAGLSSLGRKGT